MFKINHFGSFVKEIDLQMRSDYDNLEAFKKIFKKYDFTTNPKFGNVVEVEYLFDVFHKINVELTNIGIVHDWDVLQQEPKFWEEIYLDNGYNIKFEGTYLNILTNENGQHYLEYTNTDNEGNDFESDYYIQDKHLIISLWDEFRNEMFQIKDRYVERCKEIDEKGKEKGVQRKTIINVRDVLPEIERKPNISLWDYINSSTYLLERIFYITPQEVTDNFICKTGLTIKNKRTIKLKDVLEHSKLGFHKDKLVFSIAVNDLDDSNTFKLDSKTRELLMKAKNVDLKKSLNKKTMEIDKKKLLSHLDNKYSELNVLNFAYMSKELVNELPNLVTSTNWKLVLEQTIHTKKEFQKLRAVALDEKRDSQQVLPKELVEKMLIEIAKSNNIDKKMLEVCTSSKDYGDFIYNEFLKFQENNQTSDYELEEIYQLRKYLVESSDLSPTIQTKIDVVEEIESNLIGTQDQDKLEQNKIWQTIMSNIENLKRNVRFEKKEKELTINKGENNGCNI